MKSYRLFISCLMIMVFNVFASSMDSEYKQGETYGKSQSTEAYLKNPDYQDMPGYGEPYKAPDPNSDLQKTAERNIDSGQDSLGVYTENSIHATVPTETQELGDPETKAIIGKANDDAAGADRGAVFCESGDCADQDYDSSNKAEMDQYAATLGALNEDGLSYNGKSTTKQNGTAVNSKNYQCRDMMISYSNCCQDKGWGQDLHLTGCNSQEKALGGFKQEDKCVYIGEYCSDKFLGACTEHKKSYCCFDTILDKIVRDQGGKTQLHVGYGSAKHPSCTGLTVKQLQAIDYLKLNYSEYYETFETGMSDTTSGEINDKAKVDIGDLTHETGQGIIE